MFTRQEYVAICSQCKHRKFDRQAGVICSLTESHADFEEECPDFNRDKKVGLIDIDAKAQVQANEDLENGQKHVIFGLVMVFAGLAGGLGTGSEVLFGTVLIGIFDVLYGLSKIPQKKK